MSLLLLFNGFDVTPVVGFQCWATVGTNSTDWLVSHYDFKNLWSEWETTTWGAIQASGITWGGMSGLTFTTVATTPTSWSNVVVATCS